MRIRKNDTVKIISGESRGKTGKVIRVNQETQTAIVQGINLLWKHMRRSQQYPHGARIQKESPVPLCKLMLVCTNCNKPTRISNKISEAGIKSRVCKKCAQSLVEV